MVNRNSNGSSSSIKLSSVQPSASELKAARQVLAGYSKDKRRSTNTCLQAFAKRNPGNEEFAKTKGSERDEYIVKYLVPWVLEETDISIVLVKSFYIIMSVVCMYVCM